VLDPWTVAAFAPVLLAIATPFAAVILLGQHAWLARIIASATCVVCGLRYLWWRWTWSLPSGQEPWQQAWAWIFLVFETMTIASSLVVYLFMSRTRNRSIEVDARAASPLLAAPVDVFIATYNEDHDILERTIVGATNIDHPDLRVWVLDDGARPWVKALAQDLGALYHCRVKGKHAKAGNVNEGLQQVLSIGRRPAFILLLDADFVPAQHILKRTLPLFEEPNIGIVQTPQHFFNPDPIQANLLCSAVWPDEQRFFFNHLLASKDAWGAAFCCGTSAVFRVEALERCGGMPTATVTEDMLTSYRMREFGYQTVLLNEQLSLGLAPEGLKEYVSQRARWCLGALQQIRTRWSFAGTARIGLINRISCLDTALFWVSSFAFKLLMISAPALYWWTGTAVIVSTLQDMFVWLAPFLASGMVFMALIARNTVFPIMTDVTHMLAAPAIVRTVAIGLVKPWGHPFRVTAKGVSTDKVTVQWGLLAPFAFVAAGTMLGMLANMSSSSPLYANPGYEINVWWSLFNIAVLSMACAVCVELPKQRRDERFASGERATVSFPGQPPIDCTVIDISVGGARLACTGEWRPTDGRGELALDNGLTRLPFAPVRLDPQGRLAICFEHNDMSRRRLLRRLFTGGYNNEVEHVSVGATLAQAASAVFR